MLPIIWLIVALSGLKMAGHKACVIALIITAVEAVGFWKLSVICTATAALEGILNALWPICLVIVAALFTYNLTLKTGAMEQIKKMLAGVSKDKRVLALDGGSAVLWKVWQGLELPLPFRLLCLLESDLIHLVRLLDVWLLIRHRLHSVP